MSTHKPHKSHEHAKPDKPHEPRKGQKSRAPSGRAAFDDRGNATWEWHGATGLREQDIDTQRLRTIGADLSLEGDHGPDGLAPHDPYNRSGHLESDQPRPKKRTLDDLRRLSEEIIAARRKKDRGQP